MDVACDVTNIATVVAMSLVPSDSPYKRARISAPNYTLDSTVERYVSSAGLPEHTYTQSVRQCAQCAKGVLMTHFVHTFFGSLHLVHTFCGAQNTLCELFWGF